MKYFVTARPEEYDDLDPNKVKLGTIDQFIEWCESEDIFQLDTETTFVPDSADVLDERELLLIQFGSIDKKVQWLIEYTVFNDIVWQNQLRSLFEDTNNTFILHNARFDYIVIKKWLGMRVENVHCTFLMSKVLNTGYDLEKGYHSLAGLLQRFLGITIDKSEQTTFTKDVLTPNQIEYAANDVLYLYDLMLKLKPLLESWNLWKLYDRVERQVVKAYGDMELNQMRFDSNHWDKLIVDLKRDDTRIEKELNDIVMKDQTLVTYLKNSNLVLGLSLIQPRDKLLLNWASNITRKGALQLLVPELKDLDRFTKPELKKIYKADGVLSAKSSKILALYLDRNFTILNKYLRVYYKDWLVNNGHFLFKDSILINWASSIHKLYIFQFYYPKLKNTDAKALAKIHTNKLIAKYKEYSKVHKYLTTYGEKFRIKYVNKDSMIAPSGCRQILNTGRIAFGILLQMPGQARFRNAFLPPKDDWVFVDSDYSSMEVLLMAYAANEMSFIDAVKSGKDLHMMSASLIFENKWKDIAEPGCKNLIDGSKCECKKHNQLRTFSKAITFGLA